MKKLFLVLILLSVILFGFFAGFVMKVEPENKTLSINVPLDDALKVQNTFKPTPVAIPPAVAQPVLAPIGEPPAPQNE